MKVYEDRKKPKAIASMDAGDEVLIWPYRSLTIYTCVDIGLTIKSHSDVLSKTTKETQASTDEIFLLMFLTLVLISFSRLHILMLKYLSSSKDKWEQLLCWQEHTNFFFLRFSRRQTVFFLYATTSSLWLSHCFSLVFIRFVCFCFSFWSSAIGLILCCNHQIVIDNKILLMIYFSKRFFFE